MFTGIVEGQGEIKDIIRGNRGLVASISSPFDMSSDKAGDSIAVNGICLTAKTIEEKTFKADVSEETLSRTNFGDLKRGGKVNIERALKVGDRFGGHIVSGHIDGIGTVRAKEYRSGSIYMEISADDDIMMHIVEKGSVAIDGVSLTVNDLKTGSFSLNIVPHTLEVTTLGVLERGASVNIETDIIGKYVEKLLGRSQNESGVDMELLTKCGFI